MTVITKLVGIMLIMLFISMILFVVFGQFTVRKLRKNPQVKSALGIEFVSGWDIINVAQTLAFPSWLNKKLQESPLSSMHADETVLLAHTTKFDRFLGAILYWLMTLSVIFGLSLAALDTWGVFSN